MIEKKDVILNYDRTIKKTVCGERINYAIICGNEKIVFIKCGAGGRIMGRHNKYLKMAHRIHKSKGATVICSSNPDIEKGHIEADKKMITQIADELGLKNYEMYFFGTSDGAHHNLLLAKEFSNVVKIVCVNTSTSNFEEYKTIIPAVSHIDKTFIYGDKDPEYKYLPIFEKWNCDRLEFIKVAGANHEFEGMTDEFIGFIDLM